MEKKVITLNVVSVKLSGDLVLPDHALGLVIMGKAHHKSSLLDNLVRETLVNQQMATFSVDLLTSKEGVMDQKQFNIELLTERLIAVTHWLQDYAMTSGLNLGYYGSSLESATALRSAAGLQHQIKSVVCVGGDLSDALPVLHQITAPTCLVASGNEEEMESYKEGFKLINAPKSFKLLEKDQAPIGTGFMASEVCKWFKNSLTVPV